MVGKACLPSNAYYPRTPDYTLCSGVLVCWSEHSDSSFVYGFMSGLRLWYHDRNYFQTRIVDNPVSQNSKVLWYYFTETKPTVKDLNGEEHLFVTYFSVRIGPRPSGETALFDQRICCTLCFVIYIYADISIGSQMNWVYSGSI